MQRYVWGSTQENRTENDFYFKVAIENFKIAGVSEKVEVIVGPASKSLASLHPEVPFDLVFIDADKESNLTYFTEAKRLVKPGGVIVSGSSWILMSWSLINDHQIVDNVVRYGRVSDPSNTEPATEGVRQLLRFLKDDKEVEATTIATVGVRGFDGFIYAVRN